MQNLIDTASKGGNYLLNVGPDAEGIIPAPSKERLLEVGKWLKANGEAIYDTKASPFPQKLAWGRATQKSEKIYFHVLNWPQTGSLTVPLLNSGVKAYLLTKPNQKLETLSSEDGLRITLPSNAPDPIASVVVLELRGTPMVIDTSAARTASDGSVQLSSETAELIDGLRIEGQEEQNIGYWTHLEDFVKWNADIKTPKTFKVEVNYALAPGSEGSKFLISVHDQQLSFRPTITAGWNDYKTVAVGQLKIEKTGRITIKIEATEKLGEGAINLRSIKLVPIQ